ncbi:MAG TPA: hypothetical protein VKA66_23470 [Mycobacterium sp.]|jgi:hypothetical protein|nr:hypothetical protein [Mycobacterium sp.]
MVAAEISINADRAVRNARASLRMAVTDTAAGTGSSAVVIRR